MQPQPKIKIQQIDPGEIKELLKENYLNIISTFYETQSSFLSGVYKRYKSIETANIILCFSRNMHLSIIRQREKDLNHNISLNNFWNNLQNVECISEKVSSIVKITSIPKETVRRKIKKLLTYGYLLNDKKEKGFSWNLLPKHKDSYFKIIDEEISILSRFLAKFTTRLNLNIDSTTIENELKSQFSFYWYHYLSCQLQWLKFWQEKLKDNDLLLVVLQAVIPTLRYAEHGEEINLDNMFKIVGRVTNRNDFLQTAVSAASVSEITGIPRSTCIRKLDKLVSYGFLLKEKKTKRYFVNQNLNDRTKNILTKENVDTTIKIFSTYLAIIINSVVFNKKK